MGYIDLNLKYYLFTSAYLAELWQQAKQVTTRNYRSGGFPRSDLEDQSIIAFFSRLRAKPTE